MTIIILSIVIFIMLLMIVFKGDSYGLAKLVAKQSNVFADQAVFKFTVLYSVQGQIVSRNIVVSETVYYKFKEGDYLTIRP